MRGINDGGHAVLIYEGGQIEDEMNAFDQLGPITRDVLHNSPIRYSAACLVKQLKDVEAERRLQLPSHVRHLYRIDPRDPKVDTSVANGIKAQNLEVLLRDRSEHDANIGVIPLVPNIGVKSLREQRRSLRKTRCR